MSSIAPSFGSMVRVSSKNNQEYQKKVQKAVENIKTNSPSIMSQSTGKTAGGAQINIKNEAGSIWGQGSDGALNGTRMRGGLSTSDFATAMTKEAEGLDDDAVKTLQAQNELLAALADEDGDGRITSDEAQKLDVVGKDGVITDEDIAAIYEQLNVVGDDATLEDLMNAVNNILDGKEGAEEVKEQVAEQLEEAAKDQMVPGEGCGLKKDENGNYVVDEDGNYELEVETYQSGEAIKDAETGEMRYPNGSYWGIVTNVYPDATEAEKQEIYDLIAKANGVDSINDKPLYTGDTIKVPVLERGEDGKFQIAENKPAEENKEEVAEDNADEKSEYGVRKGDTPGTYGYTYYLEKDGEQTGALVPDKGKYYLDGKEVGFDTNTQKLTSGKDIAVERSDSAGTYGYSYTLPDGQVAVPDKGKYYINGKEVEFKYDESTKTASFGPKTTSDTPKDTSTPASDGTSNPPKTATTSDYDDLYAELDLNRVDIKDSTLANQALNNVLDKVESGDYNLKDFVAAYDANPAMGNDFMELFNGMNFDDPAVKDTVARFNSEFIKSYGGAENQELQNYLENMCYSTTNGVRQQTNSPYMAQLLYQQTYDDILNSVGNDFGGVSLEGFVVNGDFAPGFEGLMEAKAEFQENVDKMELYKSLYEQLEAKGAMTMDVFEDADVKYDSYGMTEHLGGGFLGFGATKYAGSNSFEEIYKFMMSEGMGAGSGSYVDHHMGMYDKATIELVNTAYANLMLTKDQYDEYMMKLGLPV